MTGSWGLETSLHIPSSSSSSVEKCLVCWVPTLGDALNARYHVRGWNWTQDPNLSAFRGLLAFLPPPPSGIVEILSTFSAYFRSAFLTTSRGFLMDEAFNASSFSALRELALFGRLWPLAIKIIEGWWWCLKLLKVACLSSVCLVVSTSAFTSDSEFRLIRWVERVLSMMNDDEQLIRCY